MTMWEVLIPVADNDGVAFTREHHEAWYGIVVGMVGGMTIMPDVEGYWKHDEKLYHETMRPVRIVTDNEYTVRALVGIAKGFYRQLSILYYKVSDEATFYE